MKIILYIIFLSLAGTAVLWIMFNYILQRAFSIPHVKNDMTPSDFGLKYKDHLIRDQKGKTLQLWELGFSNDGPVILGVHGWANTSGRLLPLAKKLIGHNYRILLLNTLNHGDSDSSSHSSLLTYSRDLETALEHSAKLYKDAAPVILLGHSLGGAAALYTSSISEHVSGVVSISTFSCFRSIIEGGLREKHVPTMFIKNILRYFEFREGIEFNKISPVTTIGKLDIPVLVVHGTEDATVPPRAFDIITNSAENSRLECKKFPGKDHSNILNSEELFEEVYGFLLKYFGEQIVIKNEKKREQ